ncbi:MAG: MBL fold metallo-hydrolase [Candidatus Kerfeldbacteria bacterium]
MTIEWFGKTCVRIVTHDSTVVIDPIGSKDGLRQPRFTPDLLLLTNPSIDTSSVSGQPFIVRGPGEYEVKKTFVYGIPVVRDEKGKSNDGEPTTMYLIEAEGISLAHLGSLGHQLGNGELERLEGVDILFIPVGGHSVLSAEKASAVISAVEPRIVIPIQYKVPGYKETFDPVNAFAKEMGVKDSETVEKLKIFQKDLPQDNMKIVILAP